MHDLTYYLQYIPKVFILTTLFTMSYLCLKDNRNRTKDRLMNLCREQKWVVAFFFYSAILLIVTILDRRKTNPYRYIFVFDGFISNGEIKWDSIQNIIAFIPYAFFYLYAFKPTKSFRAALALSIVTTCFIELIQLLFWIGDFQFEDIIFNLIGGIIGWFFFYLVFSYNKHRK